MQKTKGTLQWFNFAAGYGYIVGDNETRFIVHRRSMKPGFIPHLGASVIFSTREVPAGILAENVELAEASDQEVSLVVDPEGSDDNSGQSEEISQSRKSHRKSLAVEAVKNTTPGQRGAHRPPLTLPIGQANAGAPTRSLDQISGRDDLLATALLFQSRGDEKKAREYFEKGMLVSPPPVQLITAYVAFERNRGQVRAAREILKRSLEHYAFGDRVRSHLLAAFGHLELRSKSFEDAISYLTQSIELAGSSANTGQQYRFLALAYAATCKQENVKPAWEAAKEALTRGVNFTQEEALDLLPCLFGGDYLRLRLLWKLLSSVGFMVVALGNRLDRRFIHSPPDALTFLVRTSASLYQATYDLSDDLVVECYLGNGADYSIVSRAEESFDYYRRNANVHPNAFFLVIDDVQRLRQQLLRRAEQPGKATIIPIDDRLLENCSGDPKVANKEFQDLLQDWLFQVDRFKSNQPVSGRNFFGRERIFGTIEAQIDDSRSLGIFGLRKIGKTSILQQLRHRRLADLVAYVDLLAIPPGVRDLNYVLWLIGNALAVDAQAKYGPGILSDMELFGLCEVFPGAELGGKFDNDLNRLARVVSLLRVAARPKIVIMLDEIERLIPSTARPQGVAGFDEFFSYLRGKAQQNFWFVSIIAGANARVVEEPSWFGFDNPVFRFYQTIYIPPLEPEESSEMVTTLGRGMGISFTPHSCEMINDVTGCHPFVVRQLCSLLCRVYPARPLQITQDHVERVTSLFALEEDSTFREIVDRLRRQFPDELKVLMHLAAFEHVSADELPARFPRRLSETLAHLRGYSLVKVDDNERFSVAFPLLKKWLLSNKTSLDELIEGQDD